MATINIDQPLKDMSFKNLLNLQNAMKKILLMLTITCVLSFSGCKSFFIGSSSKLESRVESEREASWPPTSKPIYENNTFGKILEEEFESHCSKCITNIRINPNKSYIPQEDDVTKLLNEPIESAKISGENIFFFCFSDNEKAADLSAVSFNPSKVLQLGLQNKFVIKDVTGYTGFYYSSNCSGYVKSTVTGNTKLPYIALDGSIQNDVVKNSTIVLIKGWFSSPISEILAGRSLEKNLLYSSLWTFYNNNVNLRNTKVNYLNEFQGYLLKRFSSSELRSSIGLTANVNVTVPSSSFSADAQLLSNMTNLFKSNNWITIRSKSFDADYPKQTLFRELPTLDQTIEYFATIQSASKSLDGELLSVGKPHKHFHFFKGLPKELSVDYWVIESVTPSIYDGEIMGLSIDSKYVANEIGEYGCRIDVEGTPSSSLFGTSLKPFYDVEFTLRSKDAIDGKYLKLKSKIRINTSEAPRIIRLDEGLVDYSKVVSSSVGSNPEFMWTLNFLVDVSGSSVDTNSPIQIESTTLSNGVKISGKTLTQVDSNLKKYKVSIMAPSDQPESSYEIDKYDQVSSEVTLKMKLTSGSFIIKSFTNQLKYPRVKQVSQAAGTN